MSDCPDIDIQEVKISAIKFDLANMELELVRLLDLLEGDAEALSQFHSILSKALHKCEQAIESANQSSVKESRRIPHD